MSRSTRFFRSNWRPRLDEIIVGAVDVAGHSITHSVTPPTRIQSQTKAERTRHDLTDLEGNLPPSPAEPPAQEPVGADKRLWSQITRSQLFHLAHAGEKAQHAYTQVVGQNEWDSGTLDRARQELVSSGVWATLFQTCTDRDPSKSKVAPL